MALSNRVFGDSRVFAMVPFPGYPEGIAVAGDRVYVSGPAAFDVPGNAVPSRIFCYDLTTGALIDEIVIEGQPDYPRAVSCITFGSDNRLYVLDENLGVVQVDLSTRKQKIYAAPFESFHRSSSPRPIPSLLNDLTFDDRGNLYVTDSFQAAIWRIAPGGGRPRVWFHSRVVDGPFGPNGLRVDPKGNRIFFSLTIDSAGSGVIYSLPLVENPSADDLARLYTYAPGAGPDGIAFGASGKLYVALAFENTISILWPDGNEAARLSGNARHTRNPEITIAWSNPANIAFHDGAGTLLVTNHAHLTGLDDPSGLFCVFDVVINDVASTHISGGQSRRDVSF